jgi:late competence protein required for DNA uptake (superfamily II DNA/RNA helicase)
MISLVGNYFIGDDVEAELSASCNFCDRITNTNIKYDYCFHCNCYLCRDCLKEYEKYEAKKNWLCVQRDDVSVKISDQQKLTA